ncbi:MAG: hypothetical protein IPJ06_13845 [Saprospiraceae bacterium]|nr:hypothetical protein [Saprospiraceae bacterium]
MTRKIEDTCQLEICCFDLESVHLAEKAGVPSIELCTDYTLDGLWPGKSMVREARMQFSGVLRVMIRPRPGNFIYSPEELQDMLNQIEESVLAGADGITFGCLSTTGLLATDQIEQIIQYAGEEIKPTFHRAFDLLDSPISALQDLASMGVQRVLTSGGSGKAIDNLGHFIKLLGQETGGLSVVAAGSVRPEHIQQMLAAGIRHVHSSASIRPDGRADLDCIHALMKACGLTDETATE